MVKEIKLFRGKWILLAFVLIFDIAVLLSIYAIGKTRNIQFVTMTRDPAAIYGDYFVGILSNLGIMLWAAAAVVCFLGAAILTKTSQDQHFLIASGVLTTLLALDDAFLFHQVIFPDLFHVHKWQIFGIYLLFFVLYFIGFKRLIISKTDYPIILAAFLLFGLSIIIDDVLHNFPTQILQPLFEDGAKFVGISLWLAYFFISVIKMVKLQENTASAALPRS
jgi:hypothetical protein